jgi:hypothetical protein
LFAVEAGPLGEATAADDEAADAGRPVALDVVEALAQPLISRNNAALVATARRGERMVRSAYAYESRSAAQGSATSLWTTPGIRLILSAPAARVLPTTLTEEAQWVRPTGSDAL